MSQLVSVDLSWHEVKNKKILKPRVDQNEIICKKLMSENYNQKEYIDILQDIIVERDAEIEKMKVGMQQLRNQVNALRLELGNIRIMHENSRTNYNGVVSENKRLMNELVELRVKIDTNIGIEEKQRKTDIQNGMLVAKIARLTKELEEERGKMRDMKLIEENENLKKQNALITKQLEKLVFLSLAK